MKILDVIDEAEQRLIMEEGYRSVSDDESAMLLSVEQLRELINLRKLFLKLSKIQHIRGLTQQQIDEQIAAEEK